MVLSELECVLSKIVSWKQVVVVAVAFVAIVVYIAQICFGFAWIEELTSKRENEQVNERTEWNYCSNFHLIESIELSTLETKMATGIEQVVGVEHVA